MKQFRNAARSVLFGLYEGTVPFVRYNPEEYSRSLKFLKKRGGAHMLPVISRTPSKRLCLHQASIKILLGTIGKKVTVLFIRNPF